MIQINHTLLTAEALDNLLIDIITRHTTDYGEFEIDIINKKNQLTRKLEGGDAIIIYCSKEGFCDIISTADMKTIQNLVE